jgi:hypothetical protein
LGLACGAGMSMCLLIPAGYGHHRKATQGILRSRRGMDRSAASQGTAAKNVIAEVWKRRPLLGESGCNPTAHVSTLARPHASPARIACYLLARALFETLSAARGAGTRVMAHVLSLALGRIGLCAKTKY